MQPSPLEEFVDTTEDSRVDVDETIHNAERLLVLVKPIVKLLRILEKVRRWESPLFCVLVLLTSNGTCVLVPSSYYLLVTMTVFASLAGMGYAHRHTRILTKVIPSCHLSRHDNSHVSMASGHLNEQRQVMHDFHFLLILVNSVLRWLVKCFSKFYTIIKWENMDLSMRCYTCAMAVTVFLHILPLRWLVTLLLNTFLLQIPIQQFVQDMKELRRHRGPVRSVSMAPSTPGNSYSLCQLEDRASGNYSDSSEKTDDSSSDDLYTYDDASGSKVQDKESGVTGSGDKGSGVVEKIKEFKRRHQEAGSGNCVSCEVNFTTFLKRRHVCSHCGNHFCSKCCSNKIPRAYFGATAPAAQTETVPVCVYCFSYLTGGNTPGNQGSTSGNQGNMPGNQCNTPGNQGNTSGNQGSTPGNQGNTTGIQGSTSKEKVS